MSTYLQIHYHIVFCTKYRIPCLAQGQRALLFKYIWGVLNNNKCHLYRINGVEDHIHILTHIHPTVALSSLVKDIKLARHAFIKKKHMLPAFQGWQEGYGAFIHHINDKTRLIRYIKPKKVVRPFLPFGQNCHCSNDNFGFKSFMPRPSLFQTKL